jgi:precorrin-2/cobalt-factor-2 C20-methyltransferase
MQGKLYGIGVGPGDPELLTIKAKNLLDRINTIIVPVKEAGEESTALKIMEGVVDTSSKTVVKVVFKMDKDIEKRKESRKTACAKIEEILKRGEDAAMITLGDVAVYSTYMYVNQFMKNRGFETEIIPGIPSFCSGAAKAQISLMEGNESLAIVPAVKKLDILEEALDRFENVVIMKAGSNIVRIKEILKKRGLLLNTVVVSRAGMEGEYIGPIIDGMNYSYFTMMIVKKGK